MLKRLQDWWFAPTRCYQLGVFRVLLTTWVAHDYVVRVSPRLLVIAGRSREFLDPSVVTQVLAGLGLPIPPAPDDVALLRALAYGLVCAAMLGISTRLSLIALAAYNDQSRFEAAAPVLQSALAMGNRAQERPLILERLGGSR